MSAYAPMYQWPLKPCCNFSLWQQMDHSFKLWSSRNRYAEMHLGIACLSHHLYSLYYSMKKMQFLEFDCFFEAYVSIKEIMNMCTMKNDSHKH